MSLADNSFRKLTLGKLRGELNGKQNVDIRLLQLKGGIRLSFVHRYPDHDVTKNHPVSEAVQMVQDWLGETSFAAALSTSNARIQLQSNRRGEYRITSGPAEHFEN